MHRRVQPHGLTVGVGIRLARSRGGRYRALEARHRRWEFVLSDSATEFRSEGQRVYAEGEVVLSDKDTTPWWRNDGQTSVVFIAADVFWPQ